MHLALQALTEELRRLKSAGLRTVPVSDVALSRLREAYGRARGEAPGISVPPPRSPAALPATQFPTPPPQVRQSVPPSLTPKPTPLLTRAAEPYTPSVPLPESPVFELPAGTKAERWAALRARAAADPIATKSRLPGRKPVFGFGDLEARILFVGEAPADEDEIVGEPFVSPAGQILTKMLTGMGLSRSAVYVTNILSWRPQALAADGSGPAARTPTPEELAYGLGYFRREVEIISPTLIVALGQTAAQGLLGRHSFKSLGEIRSQWRDFLGRPLMVTYHPSYLLYSKSNRAKRTVWEDMLKVMERAGLPISEKQQGFYLEK